MPRSRFALRFPTSEITAVAARYEVDDQERRVVDDIAPSACKRGYFTKAKFLEVCYWKSPRSRNRCKQNDDDFVQAVTTVALSTPSERLRVEALTLLSGVALPTASVLLHLGHREPYPILDVRALWSLRVDAATVTYNFELWESYVTTCRQLASKAGVTMRELDRALWQFSRDHALQP
jgi:hypothetical protein